MTAVRTWRQIKDKGLIGSTEARVLNGRGIGFRSLMETGLPNLADEYIVTPDQFSEDSVKTAKACQTRAMSHNMRFWKIQQWLSPPLLRVWTVIKASHNALNRVHDFQPAEAKIPVKGMPPHSPVILASKIFR